MFTLEQLGIKEDQISLLAVVDRDSKPIKIEGLVDIKEPITFDLKEVEITLYPNYHGFISDELLNTTYWDWLFWNPDEISENWGKEDEFL
jgi:hypothetical protein